MKRNLVDERQPFGSHEDHMCHISTMANKAPHKNAVGATNEVGNNAKDHNPGIKDPSYGYNAYLKASQHRDNPFFWVGHPKGRV